MRRVVIIWICLLACFGYLDAQDFSPYTRGRWVRHNDELPYRLLYPLHFDSTRHYPLIVFLHGALARGNDNESQLNVAGTYFLDPSRRENFPAFVLFPQCPADEVWADFDVKLDSTSGLAVRWYFHFPHKPTQPTGLLRELLDSLLMRSYIDRSRIYIGGLSQGGMGVWDMLARYPDLFAAGFPICGAGKTTTVKKFAGKVAVWIFHGEKDDVVPVLYSREYYKKLKKAGADVRYSEYPGVFHPSWVNAFGEKDLMPWIFSKQKKPAAN